ncbi:accessory gene regulator B family protein [Paenibacillus graminis]|uniref:accessory gene regulator B family protein n=1 Tax=Paenibacillus graminis TaxID=189425 RepID=UPI002DBF241E|nr:accessory gene regulator B family protein [Paenibacillus graminis]MEC0168028.1 accessory gene regulator B family protein [Paenibacillus graminis]
MIDYIVKLITLRSVQQGIVEEKNAPVIRYGLQAMIEVTIIATSMIAISVWLSGIPEALAWLGAVIGCRSFGGGYHAKSFKACYFISVTIFIMTLVFVDILSPLWVSSFVILLFGGSVVLFACLNRMSRQGGQADTTGRSTLQRISVTVHISFYAFVLSMILLQLAGTTVLASLCGCLISQLSVLIQLKGENQ